VIQRPLAESDFQATCSFVTLQLGTLTEDIEAAVRVARTGRLDFRVGRDKHLQLVVGQVMIDLIKVLS
jgi:ribosomal protein L1